MVPPPLSLERIPDTDILFMTSDTTLPIIAKLLFLKVGVIKKMKKRAYKYQYGDVGFKNSVSNILPTSLFPAPEKNVLISHVAIVNVK